MALGETTALAFVECSPAANSLIVNGLRVAIEAKKTQHKRTEYHRQHNIFHGAIDIGADYLEASGQLPDEGVIERLNANGYVGYSLEEILSSGVFDDWEDYLGFVTQKRSDGLAAETSKKERTLTTIHESLENGSLPRVLATGVERFKSSPALKNNDRARLTSEPATDDELIRRYAKYSIACQMLGGEEAVDASRKLNIAMGFNVEKGKVLRHSFVYEILNTNKNLHRKEAVTESDIYLEWYDVLHPADKKRYLRELLNASREAPEPEYYYNVETQKLIILGRAAVKSFQIAEGREHLEYLLTQRRLIMGKKAARIYKEAESNGSIRDLGELLLEKGLELNFSDKYNSKYKEFTKEDCVNYGRLLLTLINNREEDFDQNLLENAYHLGLGPGVKSITNKRTRYRGLYEYYADLGIQRRRPGWYTHWTFETAVDHIKTISLENNGRVTKDMIRQRIAAGSDEPSPKLYEARWGFNNVLLAAEIPVRNQKISTEYCVETGVRFYHQFGRLPKKSDIEGSVDIPSEYSLRKYCGGIKGYQRLILQHIHKESALAT